MNNIGGEFDFFWLEPGATEYVAAAQDSIAKGRKGVHQHDAFEIAVRHGIPADTSKVLSFIAANRAKEANRQAAYLPYEALPKEWIDGLE